MRSVTRLPFYVLASIKKCSFEKSELPYYQVLSGLHPKKSSFCGKYF